MTDQTPDGTTLDGEILPALPPDRAQLVAVHQVSADRHPVLVYLGRLTAKSRRTMQYALDKMAGEVTRGQCDAMALDWTAMRYPHTAALRAILAEKMAPASVNLFLAALRGVLKECWRLGYTSADDFQRAADLPPVRGTSLPPGRALSMGELRILFDHCAEDTRPAGARDAAMLAVLYGAGLRRSELVSLDLADFNPETTEIRVRRGKGRKARMCYAPAGCVLAVKQWLEFRGTDHGPLFCPINRGGRITLRRLTDQAVMYVLMQRGQSCKVEHFSPHDLRRTFIGDLLDAGADISTVQQMAGHANVQTTARYDRRGEATRKKAAELLHVPVYRRKG
jgi:site-specific recombinase XerD